MCHLILCRYVAYADGVVTLCRCSVALRFWVTLVRNPEYLFDVTKSETVESNLTVLAQVGAFLSSPTVSSYWEILCVCTFRYLSTAV